MTVEALAKMVAEFITELKKNGVSPRDALLLASDFLKQKVMNEELGKMGPGKEPWEE